MATEQNEDMQRLAEKGYILPSGPPGPPGQQGLDNGHLYDSTHIWEF